MGVDMRKILSTPQKVTMIHQILSQKLKNQTTQSPLIFNPSQLNETTLAANTSHSAASEHDLSNPAPVQHETSNGTTSSKGTKNDSPPDADIKMTPQTNDTSSVSGPEKATGEETGKSAHRRHLEAKDSEGTGRAATVENAGGLEADADSSFDLLRENDELGDEYNYDYDEYVDENMWGVEEYGLKHMRNWKIMFT